MAAQDADLAMIHCRKRAPLSMTACSDSTLCCSYTMSSPRSMWEKSTPGNCCSAHAMSLRLSQIAAPADAHQDQHRLPICAQEEAWWGDMP